MYKFYIVPDAASLPSHAAIYENLQLLWDPKAESDAYAVSEQSFNGELNKASSLEFTVFPANVHYNDFHKKRTVIVVYDDDEWLFEGVVTDAPLDFFKRRKVTCAGPMTYLANTIQAPDEKNEISYSTAGDKTRYRPVPLVWYEGANPKKLKWYERSDDPAYDKVDDSAVYESDTTYYTRSGDVYSVWSGSESSWDSRPVLYVSAGKGTKYTRSADTSANAEKKYYYKATTTDDNFSGTAITIGAATKETIRNHIKRLLKVHNSQSDPFRQIQLGTVSVGSDTDKKEFKAANFRSTWDALKTDILDDYGRYFRIRLGSGNQLYLDYLELHELSSVPDSVAPLIEFANNMMQMNEASEQDDDIFTVLIPIGKNNLTVKDVTGHDSPAHSGETREVDPYIASWGGNKRYVVVSPKALKRYGYIIKTESFSDVEKADELYERAVKYIQNNYDYHQEYEVKAVDLRFIEGAAHRIAIGGKVRLKSAWHGVDTAELYVISAEHNLTNPENDSYRIGVPTSDREANNRTLTGQTQSARSKSASDSASTASGMSRMKSILEEYIHVVEDGLELSSNLHNKVEANAGKNHTEFLQTGESINLLAQKLFGVDGDGYGDVDAGYILVPKSDYTDSRGAYKNPHAEIWYEKLTNGYHYSDDTTCDPDVVGDKDYYIQRLASRVSEIEVGPGGILATVDGNYETSTYCSSWIKLNEKQILALTGHLFVDEDGHVQVTSGAGLVTDYQDEPHTEKYIPVPHTMYAENPNPSAKHWYERVLDSAGKWAGNGKADFETNDAYYKSTSDTTVDRSKYYYYKSNVREQFVASFGVYDQGNLTAGVMAQVINHPSYHRVKITEVNDCKVKGQSPRAKGWFEYNEKDCTYAITLDDNSTMSITKPYYTVENNMETSTDLWGQHIVIGRTDGYEGLDARTQGKVDKYIADHNLDGTITEIASDVVIVNALFAKFLHFDIAEGGEITVNDAYFQNMNIFGELNVSANDGGDYAIINADNLHVVGDTSLYNVYVNGGIDLGGVVFGTLYEEGGSTAGEDPANIVVGFGNITTVGDTVKIPYYLAGEDEHNDTNQILSFDKPASLGNAVWSSGGKLDIYTVGGWAATPKWKFYSASINIPTYYQGTDSNNNPVVSYDRNGNNIGAGLLFNNKPTIKAHMEITGDDWNKHGEAVAFPHDSSESAPVMDWSKDIYLDATLPYEDGIQEVKTNTSVAGPFKISPAPPQSAINQWAADGLFYELDSDSYYSVYALYSPPGGTAVQIGPIKRLKTPMVPEISTYSTFGKGDNESYQLDYGESGRVYARWRPQGTTDPYTELTGVTVSTPSKPSISSPMQTSSSSYEQLYNFDSVYEVHLKDGSGSNIGGDVYFKTPAKPSVTAGIDPSGTKDISAGDSSFTVTATANENGTAVDYAYLTINPPPAPSVTLDFSGDQSEGELPYSATLNVTAAAKLNGETKDGPRTKTWTTKPDNYNLSSKNEIDTNLNGLYDDDHEPSTDKEFSTQFTLSDNYKGWLKFTVSVRNIDKTYKIRLKGPTHS